MNTLPKLIPILLEDYNYSAAHRHAKDQVGEEAGFVKLLRFSRDSVNFAFPQAQYPLEELKEDLESKEFELLCRNNMELIRGDVTETFTELIWSIVFQLKKEEYIDFVSRVYRFNESFFKYLFARDVFPQVSFHNDIMTKKNLQKILMKKYKIYNGNILFAVREYFKRQDKYKRPMEVLLSKPMQELMELRHESVSGHGFASVSREDIEKAYGEPEEILKTLIQVLKMVEVPVDLWKYDMINKIVIQWIERNEG